MDGVYCMSNEDHISDYVDEDEIAFLLKSLKILKKMYKKIKELEERSDKLE